MSRLRFARGDKSAADVVDHDRSAYLRFYNSLMIIKALGPGHPADAREMVKISLFKKEAKIDRSRSAADARPTSRVGTGAAGDKSARSHAHRLTSDTLLLLQNFEQSCQGWFWATDSAGRLTYLTDALSQTLGLAPGDVTGSALTDHFVRCDENAEVSRTLSFIMARRSSFEKLTLRTKKRGDGRWWLASGSAQFDEAGNFLGYRGSGVDITEQRRSSEQASQLAMYDTLTDLPNRLRASRTLEASLVALRHRGVPCSVLLIDLDRFKQVNDTLGHPAGDALLKLVSERLLQIVGDK
jgi:PAS domain S-box-containing protein